MHLICVGLSHRTAPLELRERLNYSPPALRAALARVGCGKGDCPTGISELAILSTCNRLELYAVLPGTAASGGGGGSTQDTDDRHAPLVDFLVETAGLPADEFFPHLYRLAGSAAVEHLCRVAAGLDSMILGEPQILGQVVEALEMALGQGAAGPVLSALFRATIRAGKRARTETAISRSPATASSVALKLAESALGDLHAVRALVLGAGEMAELTMDALRARGARQVTVVNRTYERAAQLARRWNGQALAFEQLVVGLRDADIVIAATGAPHVVITLELVREAMASRPDRPLIFLDIAVPRDVDPAVAQIPNVRCYDLDDLQEQLNGALAGREREVPRVEAIVAEETAAFVDWLRSLEVAPVIAELRAKAEAIRRAEVERTLRHLTHLNDPERQRIDALAEALVNKLLHDATVRLKAEASNGHAAEYVAAIRHLFALDGG